MRKIKGFSYDPVKDEDVIKHIDNQINGSQYIWSLVRRDMNKQEDKIEELVKKYIEKHLGNVDIQKRDSDIDLNSVIDILSME